MHIIQSGASIKCDQKEQLMRAISCCEDSNRLSRLKGYIDNCLGMFFVGVYLYRGQYWHHNHMLKVGQFQNPEGVWETVCAQSGNGIHVHNTFHRIMDSTIRYTHYARVTIDDDGEYCNGIIDKFHVDYIRLLTYPKPEPEPEPEPVSSTDLIESYGGWPIYVDLDDSDSEINLGESCMPH